VVITPVPPCEQGPAQNVMSCPQDGGGTPPVVSFSASVCPTAAGRKASAAAGKKSSTKPVRKLWASGKGNFRTKGRYAAATIRGTRWETVDRCDGTLIRVSRGAVEVRDLVKKRTVVVTAGRPYLAKR
jgi:hypothetical protein